VPHGAWRTYPVSRHARVARATRESTEIPARSATAVSQDYHPHHHTSRPAPPRREHPTLRPRSNRGTRTYIPWLRGRAATMSAPTRGTPPARSQASDQQKSASASRPEQPKRINVAVTPEVVQALQAVIDAEQVSLTEAVRRLISYGDFVYRAVKQDGAEVLLRNGDNVREVVLL